jgi:endonuclease/exonuclease/phosphatase family metal-dependent hydrolase
MTRLLTMNALFKGEVRQRLRALGERLTGYDVVCLQEVMHRRNARLVAALAPQLRHRAMHGGALLKGGLVLLSRAPIRLRRFVPYGYSPPARTEWLMRKGAQLAVVSTSDGDLAVVNTHLSANRDDDWRPGNRYDALQRDELNRLAEAIRSLPAGLPVVAAGDFNVPHDAAIFADFLAATGLRDCMAGERGPTYRPTAEWPVPPAFDHVLVSAGLTASAQLVFQEAVPLANGRTGYLSDHYGIAADLGR